MRKICSRFLLLLLSVSLLVSCNQVETETDTDDTANTDTEISTDTDTSGETEIDWYGALDEGLNYDGYTFSILWYENDDWDIYLAPEEVTGDSLNDAAIIRNDEVAELLNIEISQTSDPNYEKTFRNMVYGDEQTYDLVCFWAPGERSAFVTEHLLYDWLSLPYVTLGNSWYNQTANAAYTLGGKQYFCVSDLTFPVHQHFRILFNKELMADMGMETPYQLVFDGEWTLDRLEEYCAGAYRDLNGNGSVDDKDQFGLGFNRGKGSAFPLNCGEVQVIVGENGFELNLFSERIVSIVERTVGWTSNQDYLFTPMNEMYEVFNDGRLLFECYSSDPDLLRDIDFDFGYLPYPKYDESQTDYVVWAEGGMMAVPSTADSPARTGAIVEALSAASSKYIKDAFIEKYVLNRILRDEESQRIYRMMRENEVYDFSYNFDPSQLLANCAWYGYFFDNKDTNVSSRYNRVQKDIEASYAKLWKAIVEE